MMGNLALIQQLTQEEIRKQILHTWESAEHSWVVPIHLGPIDISINKSVWFLFIGAAVTFLILFVGARYLKDRPGMYQVIVEELYAQVAAIAASGVSIVVVEQFAATVLGVADLAAILVQGRIGAVGTPDDIESELSAAYLGASID